MNSTSNSEKHRPTLYSCTSVENNWPHRHARYDGVYLGWFVHERPEDYAERYAGLCDLSDPYSRGVIEEAFTADEALQFAAYLKQKHDSVVEIRPIELPVPPNTAGAGAIAVGGSTDFHMLAEEDGYSLPFPVWGFYNVRDAKAAADGHREVILRLNNLAQRNSCAICDGGDRMDTPLAASLEGTDSWVCLECFEKRSEIHGIARLVNYLNGILYQAQRTPDEKLEAFLCNLDSVFDDTARDQFRDRLRTIAGELSKCADDFNSQLKPKSPAVLTGYGEAWCAGVRGSELDRLDESASDLPF